MKKRHKRKEKPLSDHQILFARLIIDAIKNKKPIGDDMPIEAMHGYIELVADDMGLDRPPFRLK